MDIPKWLYEKTGGDGTWYEGAYGKGFAPDYNNELLIRYHSLAVQAMGEHLGKDGLIAFVELGSLGHWGEWHVNYGTGHQTDAKGVGEKPVCNALAGSFSRSIFPYEKALCHCRSVQYGPVQ